MSKHMLIINHLYKSIGSTSVIKDVNLTVNTGEVFGLLGPNGAGKTTLIKMIVGLYKPTSGTIIINGFNQKEQFEASLQLIGTIVENPDMYEYMSGWKNLKQYARMYGNIDESKIKSVVETVGLTRSIHKKFKTYSLGMKQRLGIAQALLHDPKLLILDEPTNGLDPSGVHELRNYLKALCQKGISVVVSSHLLNEMEIMCDRVAIIKNGQIVDVNTVGELVQNNADFSITKYYFENIETRNAAQKMLTSLSPQLRFEPGDLNCLRISNLTKERLYEINALFISQGLNISEIINEKKTLEERFLEMTREEEEPNEKKLAANQK
jgi:ABC-2 type transport system ATP-binding protein